MTDLATLGIAVESRQVAAATDHLDRLTRSSGQAERAAMTMGRGASSSWGRMAGEAERSAGRIRRAFASVNASIGALSRAGPQFSSLSVGGIAGAIGAYLSVQEATRMVDSATRITNALKVAGLEGQALTDVYDRLFASAQKNSAPIEALVTLYGRAAIVQKELNVSTEELLSFTDNVALALRVAGTDATQASGALLQLSQALGAGTVRAEEFNSILEGALPIARAAAAGIEEAGGSVAKLRALVVDGKVSSEAFFRGFEAGAQILEEKVAGAESTVSQSFVRLQNVLIDTAGKMDEGSDASASMSSALNDLSDFIQSTDFSPLISGVVDFAGSVIQTIQAVDALGRALGQLTGAGNLGPFLRDVREQNSIQDRISGAFDVTEGDGTVGGRVTGSEGFRGTVVGVGGGRQAPVSIDMYPVGGSAGGGRGGRKGGGRGRKSEGERLLEGYQRDLVQIEERTAALLAETAAMATLNPLIDDYGYAMARATQAQELLSSAKKAGTAAGKELASVQQLLSGDFSGLSAEARTQAESMLSLANGYAEAKAGAERLGETQERIRDSYRDSMAFQKDLARGMVDGFRQGKDAADILANSLQKVADRFLDIVLNAAFDTKGGGGGGFGGILKALTGFGGGGGISSGATKAILGGAAGLFANGGYVSGPGTSTSDSIPAYLSDGEYVVNARATREHRGLLEAINGGVMAKFAAGGYVSQQMGTCEVGAEGGFGEVLA